MLTRVRALGVAMIFAAMVVATGAAALPIPCNEGGPCSCGALYNLDRCTGIGNNTCGCGAGFAGPSLGPTSDCSISFPQNSCCLPTGQTYATACQGREDGNACTSSSQCTSGACIGNICGPGGTDAAAPTLSTINQVLLLGGMLAVGLWTLRWRTPRA